MPSNQWKFCSIVAIATAAIGLAACQAPNNTGSASQTIKASQPSETKTLAELSELEISSLKAEVSKFAVSYFKAMEDLDEAAILSHVIKSPNFAYTRRGSRSNYEEFEAGTKGLVTRFTDKISTMGPMTVDLIEPDVAVMSYTFEQTLTNTDGEKRDFNGTVTWIAVKRDGEWRYIHGLSY